MAAQEAAIRSRRVVSLLELTLELEPALRGAYLESIGRQDPELKRQVLAHLQLLGSGSSPADGDATTAETGLSSLEIPQRVGPYKIVREIGRGGMSRVYLAERADQEFERQVALKVIDQGLEAPIVHQRFLAERQILASFDCPQIAKLFDGGTLPNGRPYLLMELVDGVRADQYCAERQLSLEERLRLFRKICGAVSYAHQKLVVHRDLKPSNILVTKDGEPKLLDFGIAKLLDPESFPLRLEEATRSHFRPMTPSHASPEQLLGEPITTSTDIYALGVLLFQLLTGAVPNPQQDRLQRVLRERAGDDVPPKPSDSLESVDSEKTWSGHDRRRLARRLRGDLDNIVAKALRPLPADRYASVAELDEDLRRYLDGEPVRATRETPLYLAGKFLRRYRLPVAVAATVLVLVTSFAVVTQRQARRIAEERDRANEIRGFLTNLIGSADSQSRKSGGVSLNALLDDNFKRVKDRPLRDSQAQFELLELIGNGYRSMELNRKAVEAFSLALQSSGGKGLDRSRVLQGLLLAAGDSGQLAESLAAADEALSTMVDLDMNSILETQANRIGTLETQGDFREAARSFRSAIFLVERGPETVPEEILISLMRSRLTMTHNTSDESARIRETCDTLLTALNHSKNANGDQWSAWAALERALSLMGEFEEAISSHRYIFQMTRETHGYGLSRSHPSELFAESLLRKNRLLDAKAANATSLRSAKQLLGLDPLSLRARYQVAQVEVREGEILRSLGQIEESTAILKAAIEILEPMAQESSVIFVKSTLARAYMLTGRLEQARPLVKLLLERGWRRPDWIRLVAENGLLPDPMPPPLNLDLSLPPKTQAYIDSLPHKPPPWHTRTNLPTIEEILAAEKNLVGDRIP
jgi:serine/threonine protein kinase